MANLIGEEPDSARVLTIPGAHLHRYGKEPRPGRKLGHITLRAKNEQDLLRALERMPPQGNQPEPAEAIAPRDHNAGTAR
jgi:5-(carboxyamino)imidazole ribonucleotide synthase